LIFNISQRRSAPYMNNTNLASGSQSSGLDHGA